MEPQRFHDLVVEPALTLLPATMDSARARTMLLAIALQESGLLHRHQLGGPAKSYYQFELAGLAGVLWHPDTQRHMERICGQLDLGATPAALHVAIEYHDVAATICARLLLWTLPDVLAADEGHAWEQYVHAWRPGAVAKGGDRADEARQRWIRSFATAETVVDA